MLAVVRLYKQIQSILPNIRFVWWIVWLFLPKELRIFPRYDDSGSLVVPGHASGSDEDKEAWRACGRQTQEGSGNFRYWQLVPPEGELFVISTFTKENAKVLFQKSKVRKVLLFVLKTLVNESDLIILFNIFFCFQSPQNFTAVKFLIFQNSQIRA